jgi:glycosyltransferase involved in cell wall biosynthesis
MINAAVRKYRRPVVLINGPLPPPLGGIATYCQDYLRTSLTSGFQIIFCRSNLLKSVFTTRGLVRFTLRVINSFVVICVWVANLTIKRPDIAHVHTSSYAGFYVKSLLVLLARAAGAKTILHIHGAEFKKFYSNSPRILRWLIQGLLNANSCVIALSKGWRSFFVSIGIPSNKIAVMTNCVFVPEIREPNGPSDEPTVLFVSVFDKRKGIYELVEALERRPDFVERCCFVLAGPKSGNWATVAEQVRRLNLKMSRPIEMPGQVVGEVKDRLYRQADIYVLQSYDEGMPISLLEAMSYGLACITTPVGGIPDVIQDGRNGVLIAPGDVNALIGALEQLIDNRELRLRLGHEARATVKERYNWQEKATQLKELYCKLHEVQQSELCEFEKGT